MKTITIGRSSQCDIIISGGNISRLHAEISIINGQYVYYDRSANGSSISGQIICNRKVAVEPETPILLANKYSLPWERVYMLLPLSGHRVNEAETHYQVHFQNNRQHEVSIPVTPDKLAFGWGILAFLIPIAGWIMYLIWKEETPNRANSAAILSTISFILGLVPFLI